MKKLLLQSALGVCIGLGAAPLATLALAQNPMEPELEAPCPGCNFEDPDIICSGESSLDCALGLQVEIEAIPGDCVFNEAGDCVQQFPCLIDVSVSYMSCCDTVFHYASGPIQGGWQFPAQSCDGFTELNPGDGFFDWACGSLLDMTVRLDAPGDGSHAECIFRLHCTSCWGQ
ncbi:MAG: hypothetical protein AAF682_26590 [Planctomycetota bacterium]